MSKPKRTMRLVVLLVLGLGLAAVLYYQRMSGRGIPTDTAADKQAMAAEKAEEDLFPFKGESVKLEPLKPAELEAESLPPLLVIAPFSGESDDSPSSAAQAYLKMANWVFSGDGSQTGPFNIMSDFLFTALYTREGKSATPPNPGRTDYLADAELVGAKYFLDATVKEGAVDGSLVVDMFISDLESDRTHTFQVTGNPASISSMLKTTVQEVGKFCQLTEAQMETLSSGLPGTATWDLLYAGSASREQVEAAIQKEQDSRLAYATGMEAARSVDEMNSFANRALKEWPNDSRLLALKSQILRDRGHTDPALMIQTELLKRQPHDVRTLRDYRKCLVAHFPRDGNPKPVHEIMIAGMERLREAAEMMPKDWLLRWQCAECLEHMSWYARGHNTVDKIPEERLEESSRYIDMAIEDIDKAVQLQERCPEMLERALKFHHAAGQNDLTLQKAILAKIHAIDPTNVSAELVVAYSHSVGWDDPRNFLPLVMESYERHKDDPEALNQISFSLQQDLNRLIGFEVLTREEAYADNPESRLFVTVTEKVLDAGTPLGIGRANVLRMIYHGTGNVAKSDQLAASGKSPEFSLSAGKVAYDDEDYEKAAVFSQAAAAGKLDRDKHEEALWNHARALAHLKRYDEGIKVSEQGLREYPNKGTFYYTYALNEAGKGENLEHAYQYASKALSEARTYEPYMELHAELSKRLGKN